jgi:hypothetical protein
VYEGLGDSTPPHVIAIQLLLNNLVGTLPSLNSLTSMQLFALNTNQLDKRD